MEILKGFWVWVHWNAPIVCQQVAIPIFSGGMELILWEVITLANYLRSWASVAHVITSKILLDFCPLLLETINASSSGLGSLSKQI